MDDTYKICWDVDTWVSCLKEAQDARWLAEDFETSPDQSREFTTSALRPEDNASIAGIGIAWWCDSLKTIKSAYVGIRHYHKHAGGKQPSSRQVIKAFDDFHRKRRKSLEKVVVVHNLGMELQFHLKENIAWPAVGQIQDIQVAARVLNKGAGWKELIGLKPLQKEILGRNMDSKNLLDTWLKKNHYKKGADIWRAPVPIAGWYGQDDARDTLEIFLKWKELIYQEPTNWWWERQPNKVNRKDLYELEIKAAIDAIVVCMRGTRINLELAKNQASAAELLQDVCRRWVRNDLDLPTINPGSSTQLRGILFGGSYGFKVSLQHMTDSFKKFPDKKQSAIVAGRGDKALVDYTAFDVDALSYYAKTYPEHADLMFVLAIYRKCNTAMQWFGQRVLEFAITPCPDPWYDSAATKEWLHLMFHRLRTVGTISGRMSSSDYNGQQVPKRFKMLLDAARLMEILSDFLPESQLKQLFDMLVISQCKEGDESKVLRLEPGSDVVDFSVRQLFIPRPQYNMRCWDLSQVEIRGFAHYTGNKLLCGGYGKKMSDKDTGSELACIQAMMCGDMEAAGRLSAQVDWERHKRMELSPFDAHQFVADEIGLDRKGAKGINFGLIYGMGMRKLARNMGWSKAQSSAYLGAYHTKFFEIKTVQARIKVALRDRGYVFDPFGRRYYLPVSRAYVGLNRLIQGWAASVFKVGFVRTVDLFESPEFGAGQMNDITGRRTQDGARVLSCIHDEQMGEVHKELDDARMDWAVRSCMTAFYGVRVPLASSSERSNKSWDDVTDVKSLPYTAAA